MRFRWIRGVKRSVFAENAELNGAFSAITRYSWKSGYVLGFNTYLKKIFEILGLYLVCYWMMPKNCEKRTMHVHSLLICTSSPLGVSTCHQASQQGNTYWTKYQKADRASTLVTLWPDPARRHCFVLQHHCILCTVPVYKPLCSQSNQSAGPVCFLIFCSISIILLASPVAGRKPQWTAVAD
jgi:hypothetical protein